jgi:hypothetical protein
MVCSKEEEEEEEGSHGCHSATLSLPEVIDTRVLRALL